MSQSKLTRLTNAATVEDVVAVIERDGGVIIEGFLSADALRELNADLEPILNVTPFGEDPTFAGVKTRRAGALFARSRRMVDIVLHPLYKGTADSILKKPVDVWFGENRVAVTPMIQVGMTQAIQIGPGQGEQPLHRDDTVFSWRHPTFAREARLQIMVAASDFTAENGGTLVIPGSHKWDDERQPSRAEAISTEMTAGSALIWVGSLYHAGGQNKTETARLGVTMSIDLGNLRQEENQYLSLPIEKVRSLPSEVQQLLGWSAGDNYMGWVEIDGQMCDPQVLLRTESDNTIEKRQLQALKQ